MKFTTIAATALTAGSLASAQVNVPDYASLLSYYSQIYATDSAYFDYLATHSFTTPAALSSWMAAFETATDPDQFTKLLAQYPTAAVSEYVTQFEFTGGRVLAPTGAAAPSDTMSVGGPTGASSSSKATTTATTMKASSSAASSASAAASSSSKGAAAMPSALSYGVLGLAGVVAGLALY